MAGYLVTMLEDEPAHASQSPRAMSELIDESATYADELRRAARLEDRGRLRPSNEGKRVRREGDRVEVHDGPFAEEGKEPSPEAIDRANTVRRALKEKL